MYDLFADGFFTGINYWGSKSAINMWNEFDAASIEEDLRLMQDAGITHLRFGLCFSPCMRSTRRRLTNTPLASSPFPILLPAGRAFVRRRVRISRNFAPFARSTG